MSIFILGIGGTTRPGSTTEKAIRVCLNAAEAEGAETLLLGGADLMLPLYTTDMSSRTKEASRLVGEIRRADGIIIGSPGYHGTVSGLVKNALDYVEDLREDQRTYFDGRAVGCVGVAAGWQATVATVTALRSVVHALRGWPTPCAATLNSTVRIFDEQGVCVDDHAKNQLELVGKQVFEFAKMVAASKRPTIC